MDGQRIPKAQLFMLGFFMLFFGILVGGCGKGNTGPAGPAGPPGSFSTATCTDCHHLNTTTITSSGPVFIDGLAGTDQTVTAGSGTTLIPVLSKLPAGETASAFLWTQVGGLASLTSSTIASSITVTIPPQAGGNFGYKQALLSHVPPAGVITTPTGTVLTVLRDATTLVPVTNDALELATAAQFELTVFTASGKSFFDLVDVFDSTAQTFLAGVAAVNNGLLTVPINVPVLVKAKTAGSFNWTVTGPGGAVAVNDSSLQIANFTPTTPGTYTVSVNGVTFTVFAGTWRGEAIGVDGNNDPVPDTACTACHSSGGGAIDNFTPWKSTGHAHIFSKNLNSGGHYGPSCFQCHTVGFNTNPTAVNNGFDDQPNYSTFIADSDMFGTGPDSTRYSRMWSSATYSALAKETNVQCEHCHGPQSGATGFVASHQTTTNPSIGGPRTSMAAEMCAFCHGEPLRHARYLQWLNSGHGRFDLAIEEGTLENNAGAASCASCHTAQGFLIYLAQLQAGNPLRTIPTGSISWNADTVQPQTCAVCHDPHAEGASSGVPNTATVRVTDNTPKLPGGFIATGVGRGAICIVCHNSRNGASGSDTFLHQDGDPKFGTLSSYAGPHIANQGDVLMGHNAYFVGNGDMRSPHSLIADTCATCHLEQSPPPPLLSYNLSGTNHTFRASLNICINCHGTNQALGPMLQKSVQAELDLLQTAIVEVIMSRTTGTPIASATLTTSHGSPAANLVFADGSTALMNVGSIPGLCINGTGCLGSDVLAKGLWNYFLIQQDQSLGVHNPDFTFLVLGETKFQVDTFRLNPLTVE